MTNELTPPERDERAADAEADAQAARDNDEVPAPEEDRPPTDADYDADYGVAFSPRQVAGGFAIVAGLVALIVGLRRSRKKR
jgi:hypothetical protein